MSIPQRIPSLTPLNVHIATPYARPKNMISNSCAIAC